MTLILLFRVYVFFNLERRILKTFHQTALQQAAFYGHYECVQSLLGAGANVNAKNVR